MFKSTLSNLCKHALKEFLAFKFKNAWFQKTLQQQALTLPNEFRTSKILTVAVQKALNGTG